MQAKNCSFQEVCAAVAAVVAIAVCLTVGGMRVEAATANTANGQALKVLLCGDGKTVFSDDCGVQGLETALAAVLGQLLFSSGTFDLQPGILSSFSWDFDKNWYVLELQDGLRFHNGRAATSEDLEFSLLRGLLSKKGSWFKSFFANVKGISSVEGKSVFRSGMVPGLVILDKRRLAVRLDAPNPSFLHSLARSYFSLVPKEALKDDYLTWKSYPVGAGPYKVVKSGKAGAILELERVQKSGSGPKRLILSSSKMKDIDISVGVSVKQPGFSEEQTSIANSVTGIYFNFDNDLGSDPAFRKAISLAVQRKALVEGLLSYSANAELLASQFWGRAKLGENQNVELAKKELAKTKKKMGAETIKIPVFNSEFGNGPLGNYISILSEQLRAIGLSVTFFKSEKKFFDSSDRGTPFRIISLGADVADPLVLFGLFRAGSPMTPHFPKNDKAYEALYQKAAKAESLDAKSLTVIELSKYFVDHVYAVPLFERRGLVEVNRDRIKSLGEQTGSLALYLDRVVLR